MATNHPTEELLPCREKVMWWAGAVILKKNYDRIRHNRFFTIYGDRFKDVLLLSLLLGYLYDIFLVHTIKTFKFQLVKLPY